MTESSASARVIPFRGWRYVREKVGELSSVIAPPYDVIDDPLRERLKAMSAYNCVRLVLPDDRPGDDARENRYTRAGEQWRAWRREGVLAQEARPAFYFVEQHFRSPTGEDCVRSGFLGLFHLEDDEARSGIKGHERTLDGPKADRLRIFQSTEANLSPIFSVYSDPSLGDLAIFHETSRSRPPDFEGRDHLGILSRLWCLDRPETLSGLQRRMEDMPLLIADGHHRFETAKTHRARLREAGRWSPEAGCNWVMMYFANLDAPGMHIFPFHRLVHSMPGLDAAGFLERSEAFFDIAPLPSDGGWKEAIEAVEKNATDRCPAFAVRLKDGRWFRLSLKKDLPVDRLLSHVPEALRRQDVVILHRLLFEKGLGMTEADQAEKRYLDYHAAPEEALRGLERSQAQAALFLRAPTREQIRQVVDAGEKMPQKSTYFYPKIVTGLVFNALDQPIRP